MAKKHVVIVIMALVVGAGGGFYGGMKYQQSQTPSRAGMFGQNFQNLSPEQRQAFGGQLRAGQGGAGRAGSMGGFITGEVISQDEKSITVKLRDGGSKIVFLSETTGINKQAAGAKTDLAIGTQVVVTGAANSDGSVTAQNISINSNLPNINFPGSAN